MVKKMNKLRKKQLTPIVLAVLLMIIGFINISLPILGVINLKGTLLMSFGLISLFNLVSFCITYKDKDLESILTFIVSIVIMILIGLLDLKQNVNVAVILMVWVAFISLVRLKKADYYNDRKNKAWVIQMISIAIFILTGLLTAVNLSFTSKVQILILGYFFLINGILELVDPLILYLGKLNENRK